VLPHLVPTLVYATRMDTLPYMRPFTRELSDVDLVELFEMPVDDAWTDDGRLAAAILDQGGRADPLHAATAALRSGAGVDGLLDVVVETVSARLLRYDPAGEVDVHDDFGWLDITHGVTMANAVRWHAAHEPAPDTVRLALWCVFLAHWTGRHEWHTRVAEPTEIDLGTSDLEGAGVALQRRSLDDPSSSFIVHAHAVKTARAASEEASRSGSPLPLQAATWFIEGPKRERTVAANVARAIDFISGRSPRDRE